MHLVKADLGWRWGPEKDRFRLPDLLYLGEGRSLGQAGCTKCDEQGAARFTAHIHLHELIRERQALDGGRGDLLAWTRRAGDLTVDLWFLSVGAGSQQQDYDER